MKSLKSFLSLWIGLLLFTIPGHAANWLTDLGAAKTQAARENKHVMINFTGSDWCSWCIKLKQEVFSQPEFEAYAAANLVLVEMDFPKRKQIPKAILQANIETADRMKIAGYPTLVFLNPAGKEVNRGGYQPGGAKPFVQALAKLTGAPADKSTIVARAAERQVPDLPLYGGAPPATPQNFDDIVLKSISGTKDRRFAMLNNTTFAAGDTARLKLSNGDVKVQCVEIRDASVIVAVDGQPGQREIKLKTIR